MTTFPNIQLPTLDSVGISSLPPISPVDAKSIAHSWLASLSATCSSADTIGTLDLLHPSTPFWRDILALTWNIRTFIGPSKIATFLDARLSDAQLHEFTLNEMYTVFQQPFSDLAWISLIFNFKTKVGGGTGVARLVPLPKPNSNPRNHGGRIQNLEDLEWKAHTVLTNLESLKDFPEKVGKFRNSRSSHGKWVAEREAAAEFAGAEEDETKGPKVLLIGAGQSGLEVSARLKALDISTLVVDKNERIGDNWRERYEALCLHDPVWYDHMPYLPFPSTWPVFCPSQKLANWLEHYAEALELDVWMSSTITSLTQDPDTKKWRVTIIRHRKDLNGKNWTQERKLVVNHVIFCTGLGSPNPQIPLFPGLDVFKGKTLHSTQHKRALDHQGKKVVIIGACTSAHDIAVDYYEHGVDVTIFQRGSTCIMSTEKGWEVFMKGSYWEGSPPVEISDNLSASFPLHSIVELSRRRTRYVAELDKDLLESLHKVGFRTNLGYDDTGFMVLAKTRAGGYYLDTGGSKLIAEGKIKLKNDSNLSHFTDRSMVFENGSELEADVVVFATGLGETVDRVTAVLSQDPANAELVKELRPIWGVDSEGETNGIWKANGLGLPGLWYMLGNLGMCRFHSAHVALQIKAMEEGIWGGAYED